MAADKVVPKTKTGGGRRQMAWERPGPNRYFSQNPIEVGAALVGELSLFVNPNLPRWWMFKLRLRDEEVFRWDLRPSPAGHSNPPGRPTGFPGKVRETEHEHVWVEGLDLKCARPLEGLRTSDHRATFEVFCERTSVRFEPEYVAPQAFEQLELDDD